MADVLTKEQRSRCMSAIKGRNTKPERLLRSALWRAGFRFRIHHKLIGKPDIVFTKKKVCIFIDGCFWHGCPEHCNTPATNTEFWTNKIGRNIERDKEVTVKLKKDGWTVIRVWEHEVRHDLVAVVRKLAKSLR